MDAEQMPKSDLLKMVIPKMNNSMILELFGMTTSTRTCVRSQLHAAKSQLSVQPAKVVVVAEFGETLSWWARSECGRRARECAADTQNDQR